VNSFTAKGKMEWARACGLEDDCKELLASLISSKNEEGDKSRSGEVLVTYKNRIFYDMLHCNRKPPFHMNNAEGKHRGLAFCSLAIGRYVDPATGSINAITFDYKHFAKLGIISSKT
jgi:hypothetical protein